MTPTFNLMVKKYFAWENIIKNGRILINQLLVKGQVRGIYMSFICCKNFNGRAPGKRERERRGGILVGERTVGTGTLFTYFMGQSSGSETESR